MAELKKELMEQKLWDFIEKELFYVVPKYMKLALSSKGRANPLGLSKLKESDIRNESNGILHFIRYEMPKLVDDKKLFEYYGKYVSDPKLFVIEEGDIDSILAAAECIRENLKTDKCFLSNYLKRTAEQTVDNPEHLRQQSTASYKIQRLNDAPLSDVNNSEINETDAQSDPNRKSSILRMSGILGVQGSESIEKVEKIHYNGSTLLDILVNIQKRKTEKSDRSTKYPETLKDIAAFIYISGGRSLYNFLEHNLPLPSCSSVRRYIYSTDTIVEGQLRIKELKTFLQEHNLPKKIWLSDDSTGIVNKIRYDRKSNQLIGFVLPFDENGMPKIKSFSATSAKAIENIFQNNNPARLLYTVIAQPLAENAPFFCLLMFGTDDKYSYEIVQKRWNFIKKRLEVEGIEVVGQSTDGDSRAFKVMRIESGLICGSDESTCNIPEFKARLRPNTIFMQDTVHIGAKLKARFGKTSLILPLGNSICNISHLKILINATTKDEHGLTLKDIYSIDKMNFDSVLRISNPRVIDCLEKYVPNSEGTRKYLSLIYMVLNSILQVNLSLEIRIYYIWYCVFFLRLWRAWLLDHEEYSPEHNFITLNSYICIEINAHGLYNVILKCIDNDSFNEFFPYMFGSQPCESFYRLLRSTSSVFSTVVNCDLFDSMCRVKKIERLCQTSNKNFGEDKINFPRVSQFRSSFDRLDKKKFSSYFKDVPEELPVLGKTFNSEETKSKAEAILKEILRISKSKAHEDIQQLGMIIPISKANSISIKPKSTQLSVKDSNCIELDMDNVNDGDFENDESAYTNEYVYQNTEENTNFSNDKRASDSEDEDDDVNFSCNHDLIEDLHENPLNETLDLDGLNNLETLKVSSKYSDKASKICKNCPYTYVLNKCGNRVLVWKSSLVWLLSKGVNRVSSDRLTRVQLSKHKKDKYTLRRQNEINDVLELKEIFVGDWCIFKQQEDAKSHVIGLVLHFSKNFEEKSSITRWKKIEHKDNFVDLTDKDDSIGILCQWYRVNFDSNELEYLSVVTHGYTEISNYVVHIPHPSFQVTKNNNDNVNKRLILKSDHCNKIKIIFESR